ncbi:hypothetical protein RchiOBHm_Chr5g0023051 [Rosa chinensis]|uniref:Uncharacterized protein n=1 Tax=Rosa chinensis TaxID=74649 RepID=A0A2P6Q7Y7_ROSCH|nr:hypothetical protein RchiOBHm_Chr5g0023051 [Rosa chinensis]
MAFGLPWETFAMLFKGSMKKNSYSKPIIAYRGRCLTTTHTHKKKKKKTELL